MDYADIQQYTPIPQYILSFIILFYVLIKSKQRPGIGYDRIVLYLTIYFFAFVSILFGLANNYEVNIKPIVISTILIFFDTREFKPTCYKFFLKAAIILIIPEYLLAYSGLYDGHITRFGLIRPFGVILDMHLLSGFITIGLFSLGYKKLSPLLAVFFACFQSVASVFVLLVRWAGKVFLILILVASGYILWSVGHLSIDEGSVGLVKVFLKTLEANIDLRCMFLGCAVNITNLEGTFGQVIDNGLFRVGYQFGFIWLLFVILMLRRYNFFFLTAHLASILHYPVFLGILGSILMMLNLKYVESPEWRSDFYREKKRGRKRFRLNFGRSTYIG